MAVRDAAVPDEPGAGAQLHQVPAADRHRAAAGRAGAGGGHVSGCRAAFAAAGRARAAAHPALARIRATAGRRSIFETVRALVALRAALDAVVGSTPIRDVHAAHAPTTQAAQAFEPFGRVRPRARSSRSGFERSSRPSRRDARSRGRRAADAAGRAHVHVRRRRTARFRRRRCVWEYNDGGVWRALDAAARRHARVHAQRPRVAQAAGRRHSGRCEDQLVPATDPVTRYWMRARVVKSQYEKPPRAARDPHQHRRRRAGGDHPRRGARRQRRQPQSAVRAREPPVLAGLARSSRSRRATMAPSAGPRCRTSSARARATITTCSIARRRNPDRRRRQRQHAGGVRRRSRRQRRRADYRVRRRPARQRAGGCDHDAGRRRSRASTTARRQPAGGALAAATRRRSTRRRSARRASLQSRDRAVTAETSSTSRRRPPTSGARRRCRFPPGLSRRCKLPGVGVGDRRARRRRRNPMPMPTEGMLRTVCAYLDAAPAADHRAVRAEAALSARSRSRGDVVALDDADARAGARAIVAMRSSTTSIRCAAATTGRAGRSAARSTTRASISACSPSPASPASRSSSIALDGEEQPACTDVPIAAHGLLYSTAHAIGVGHTRARRSRMNAATCRRRPEPPHDPTSLLLNGALGWRASRRPACSPSASTRTLRADAAAIAVGAARSRRAERVASAACGRRRTWRSDRTAASTCSIARSLR